MSVDNWSNHQLWYSRTTTIPERSRLHPLEPIGVGTPTVESLTSYVARLAAAHRVPTGIFLAQEVAPQVSRYQGNQHQGLSRWFFRVFFNDTGAWNGMGIMASEPVHVLEARTKQHQLRFLTLLSWANVLPSRGLLRTNKAWCPVCYDDWERCGKPIYEPLLWSLQVVTTCPFHQQVLWHQCPNCQRLLYPLEWNSRPGFCSRCQQWLGVNSILTNGDTSVDASPVEQPDWDWQIFVVYSVGKILELAPALKSPPPRENLALAIDLCIQEATNGNAKAFADLMYLSASVPGEWRCGQALAQLGLLLRVCWCLSIPLEDVLTGQVVKHQPLSLKVLPITQQRRKTNRRFDAVKVQTFLEAALSFEPPQSLRQVAATLGYDPGDISRFFPDLCHQISARYRLYKQVIRKS
ncbi:MULTISPECIES: TniQ family protein [unclassified Coleofasciculus]|uniref:TniQ family protein n=1 Tax=unclassified Coleofasciculus TaxID=2692782 RepID=UPI00187FE8B0|nr:MULTISPECIES: TniQ family protein [unclassified Coleofasciculus]MBE9127722.1 TniQ family protein [Coleofasciculus sp. LEGE 07081]MBE9149688.1 TniQ family protein [Coleofasciculus sp. LEGE 07092]